MNKSQSSNQHPQARLFRVLAEHVARFPRLPRVNIASGGLQISSCKYLGEPAYVDALLMWAKTLTVESIELHAHEQLDVYVHGLIGGTRVTVWTTDHGDLRRWVDPTKYRTEISLQQLADYVTAGTAYVMEVVR